MRPGLMALAAGFGVGSMASIASGLVILGNGESINLGTLLASGSDRKFQVYDKIFTVESFTSNQFMPQSITVVGVALPQNPLECVGFDLNGGFGDPTPGDGTIHEFNLRYTVELADPWLAQGFRIKDNSLIFNGSAAGLGSYAEVEETVMDPMAPGGMQLVGQKAVYHRVGPTGASVQLQDSLQFPPPYYALLEINKDAKFFAVEGGQASASFIRQCFSQVPGPGGIGLMILAGPLLFLRRRG